MAGMTKEGLQIKRLNQVLASLKQDAIPIFQDLVEPNDIVDTSDSSALGRIIGLLSPSIADLYEAIQEVYWAYDINSATGIALDNLGQIVGVDRKGDTPTQADIYVEGDIGTNIQNNNVVRSSTSGKMYDVVSGGIIARTRCIGVGINIPTISSGTYTLGYRLSGEGTAPYHDINVVLDSNDDLDAAYTKFENEIASNYNDLSTYRRNNVLFIRAAADFQLVDFIATTPVQIIKGVVPLLVRGQETGEIEEPVDSLNKIGTPVLGWDRVWNPVAASTGTLKETDEQYRVRLRATKFQRATNIIEALYTELFNLDNVEEVIIYENDKDTVDQYGNPPHSFLTIVEGGVESDIARAIWNNKPAGILSNGTTQITIIDSQGFPRPINFSRPSYKDVYVDITLTTFDEFPANGEALIKEAIVKYIESLEIGQDVVLSRLFTPINSVKGHQVDHLHIGFTGSPSGFYTLPIDFDEKAVCNINNITFS